MMVIPAFAGSVFVPTQDIHFEMILAIEYFIKTTASFGIQS
jgi:hypothetical protein